MIWSLWFILYYFTLQWHKLLLGWSILVFCCILCLFVCVIVKHQARDTVYTVYSWFVWWMAVMHVVLKCTGMFLHLLTYFIVFWVMRRCSLVHFQLYLGGHFLIWICCSCFVEFVSSIMENLPTSKKKLTSIALTYNHTAGS